MSDPTVSDRNSGAVRITRLPGKPLVSIAGKPMVQRVYERAKMAQTAHR